ncbi:MAG: zinc ribbon domain-containing protein [Spirochaetales bacterium]|nr:zinc ribbon domain-containing protein [Spirochaetales bacterium]
MFFFIGGLEPRREVLDPGPFRCPSCGRKTARIEQVRSYLSLFFIPLFPVRKGEPYLVCESCGAVGPLRGEQTAGFPEAYVPETYEDLDDELAGELNEGSPFTCPECGGPIEPEYEYCPYCGKRLDRKQE